MPEPLNQARSSVSTTLISGIGRVQRLPGDELVAEVLVRGDLHGLRCSVRMARELWEALDGALKADAPHGRQATARRDNFAPPEADGIPFTARRPIVPSAQRDTLTGSRSGQPGSCENAPITKPNGRIL